MTSAAGPGAPRRNGLTADAWVALAEVDPRVVRVVLPLLAEQGIAAYAVPLGGRRGPYLEVHTPPAPAERLYVDARAAAPARTLLDRLLADPAAPWPGVAGDVDAAGGPGAPPGDPGAPPGDPGAPPGDPGAPPGDPAATDAAFAAIVADFDRPSPMGRPWPPVEELDRQPVRPAVDADPLADEHFVPPAPPPLPRPDRASAAAWAGLLGGLGTLIGGAVIGQPLSGAPLLLGVGAACAGFVTLMSRRPWRRDDDDPNDGAVV